jgi:hypothetical protein
LFQFIEIIIRYSNQYITGSFFSFVHFLSNFLSFLVD